ncbi:MAG: type II secretion system protein GspD, partial [Calditrichia bacterium]
RIGKTVPIQEVSRGVGGDIITFRDKQIDIFLEVIPKITSDGKIVLKVHPVMEEIIGFTGPVDFPQPITATREVKTSVIVNNGETLVLGGLIKETESELVEKVWLLGDIPILKYLFRHKFTKKEKSDLLIFITPILLE